MARIRSVKPDFFTSLTNCRLTLEQRTTFIGLWTHCDDGGRCIDDARLIRSAIWPLPVPTKYGLPGRERPARAVEADLEILEKEDKIIRYRDGDMPLIQVTNWKPHQVINHPKRSKYPPPEGYTWEGSRQ